MNHGAAYAEAQGSSYRMDAFSPVRKQGTEAESEYAGRSQANRGVVE